MLKKFLSSCLFVIFLSVSLYTTKCYATFVVITNDNLEEAFQRFVSSEANKENYNISVSNNVIDITVDNENYTLNYDLTNKPIFSIEIPITKGMNFTEFQEKNDEVMLLILGYIAVANIQGSEMEDAISYFVFSYLNSVFNSSWMNEDPYVIVRNRSYRKQKRNI